MVWLFFTWLEWFVFRFDFYTWSFAHPDANLWAFLKVISGWGEGGGAGDLPCSGNYRPGDKLPTLLTPNQPRNVSSEQDLNPVVNAPWGWSHNWRGWPPRHAQAGAAGDNKERIYVRIFGLFKIATFYLYHLRYLRWALWLMLSLRGQIEDTPSSQDCHMSW